MGDGYELSHMKAFDKLAGDIPPLFERKEPFHEYWSYFNFLRASLVSGENGVDGFGREYDTALDAKTLNTFAGHVGIDAARVRMVLEQIPEHDGLAICFVKNGVAGTGGGGFATIGGRSADTTIHEWGHAFAGLADEYEVLLIRPPDLEPGVYRVVCRVKDSTLLRGERWPLVLEDDQGFLESERVWWIEVAPR
ncbi:MAG: M64 family metallopeptidase [Planctomycetota bacterium]